MISVFLNCVPRPTNKIVKDMLGNQGTLIIFIYSLIFLSTSSEEYLSNRIFDTHQCLCQ